jgi:hypothetical protein
MGWYGYAVCEDKGLYIPLRSVDAFQYEENIERAERYMESMNYPSSINVERMDKVNENYYNELTLSDIALLYTFAEKYRDIEYFLDFHRGAKYLFIVSSNYTWVYMTQDEAKEKNVFDQYREVS